MSAIVGRARHRDDRHPAPRATATTSGGRGWRLLVTSAAVLGVVAVVAAAVWSLTAAGRSLTLEAGAVVVGSGVARVDQVVSAARPQHAMPGMGSDDDPVADGERRVSVEVTLRASGGGPLRFSVHRFALRTPGGPARPPHRSVLPETEMPPGTTLSGVLVFDVPRDAAVGQLSYGDTGRPTELLLPSEDVPAPVPSEAGSPTGRPDPGHSAGHDAP